MATQRVYLVSFNRAERTDSGSYRISFSIGVPSVNHEVTASNFDDLEREVRRLAGEFGTPCSPYVRLKGNARKPAGFDAWNKPLGVVDPANGR